MRLIDADKFLEYLIFSKHIDSLKCAEVKEAVEMCEVNVLDKIRAEIAEYGSIWVAYAITDKTKTDKGIERLVSDVLSQAKKQVLDIIDKYKGDKA